MAIEKIITYAYLELEKNILLTVYFASSMHIVFGKMTTTMMASLCTFYKRHYSMQKYTI